MTANIVYATYVCLQKYVSVSVLVYVSKSKCNTELHKVLVFYIVCQKLKTNLSLCNVVLSLIIYRRGKNA